MAKKTWYFRLENNTSNERKKTTKKKIRELEKKLQRLEQEKIILNRVIDIADEQLHSDIRKKYLALLSQASKQQRPDTSI